LAEFADKAPCLRATHHANPRISAIGTPCAMFGSALPNRGYVIMKTLYCFCAALAVSLSLIATTVVVPLGASQFIA
jgi:hypothetical protein